MSDTPAGPFAGMKLTEQVTLSQRGTDQQLFATPQRQTRPAPAAPQRPPPLPTQQGSQEPTKVGTQVRQQPAVPTLKTPPLAEARPLFNINDPATEKNSYMFSEEELWALRDVEAELERTYRTEVSKYNIIRLGLHLLLEDYHTDRTGSYLVRKLGLTST